MIAWRPLHPSPIRAAGTPAVPPRRDDPQPQATPPQPPEDLSPAGRLRWLVGNGQSERAGLELEEALQARGTADGLIHLTSVCKLARSTPEMAAWLQQRGNRLWDLPAETRKHPERRVAFVSELREVCPPPADLEWFFREYEDALKLEVGCPISEAVGVLGRMTREHPELTGAAAARLVDAPGPFTWARACCLTRLIEKRGWMPDPEQKATLVARLERNLRTQGPLVASEETPGRHESRNLLNVLEALENQQKGTLAGVRLPGPDGCLQPAGRALVAHLLASPEAGLYDVQEGPGATRAHLSRPVYALAFPDPDLSGELVGRLQGELAAGRGLDELGKPAHDALLVLAAAGPAGELLRRLRPELGKAHQRAYLDRVLLYKLEDYTRELPSRIEGLDAGPALKATLEPLEMLAERGLGGLKTHDLAARLVRSLMHRLPRTGLKEALVDGLGAELGPLHERNQPPSARGLARLVLAEGLSGNDPELRQALLEEVSPALEGGLSTRWEEASLALHRLCRASFEQRLEGLTTPAELREAFSWAVPVLGQAAWLAAWARVDGDAARALTQLLQPAADFETGRELVERLWSKPEAELPPLEGVLALPAASALSGEHGVKLRRELLDGLGSEYFLGLYAAQPENGDRLQAAREAYRDLSARIQAGLPPGQAYAEALSVQMLPAAPSSGILMQSRYLLVGGVRLRTRS